MYINLIAQPPQLDSWSAGALAYDVLCGRAPFATREGIERDEEAANILGSDPDFPSGLSYNAVSFMMQVGARAQAHAGEGKGAGWGLADGAAVRSAALKPPGRCCTHVLMFDQAGSSASALLGAPRAPASTAPIRPRRPRLRPRAAGARRSPHDRT